MNERSEMHVWILYAAPQYIISMYNIMPPKKTAKKLKLKTKPMKKAEIVKIAKNAVKTVAEKKWFNTAQLNQLNPTLPSAEGATAKVSGIGFSTTEDVNESGSELLWCGQQVHEMFCLRPWSANSQDVTTERAALAMEGKWLQPVSSKSRFRISRNHAKIDPAVPDNNNNPTIPDYPKQLAQNCPVICRIMRVTPKLSSSITTEISPDTDIFINEYGEALGPAEDDFDVKEMVFYKINKRRYTVLEDRKVKILSPVTLQYQSYRLNNTNAISFTPVVSNTNANCERYVTMYHQLSKNKGGKVYYEDPLAVPPPTTATSGHRREYTLMLFAYQGADEIVGDNEAVQIKGPTDINIDMVNYSKFIDV